jgi:hypothetical protein
MSDNFEYISHARLIYRDGYRNAYLGEVEEPVIYGVQGALREYYGAKEGPPIASTLDHIVAAVAGWMYGTLAGALSGRKITFDRQAYTATVDGRIAGVGKTIRIVSIALHYDLTVPPDFRDATERALKNHPGGCPAHQSVKDAITITWDATLRMGDEVVLLKSADESVWRMAYID